MTSIFVVQGATWNHSHHCLRPWGWTLRWPDFGGAFGQLHEGRAGQEKNTKAMEMVLMLKIMLANTIFFGKLEAMATNSEGQTKSATFPFSRRTSQTLFFERSLFCKTSHLSNDILATGMFAAGRRGVPSALLDEGLRNLPPDQRVVVRDFQTSVTRWRSDSPNVSPSDLSF